MSILGIDPGTHRIGWGIVSGTPYQPQFVAAGCLDLPSHTQQSLYLTTIYQQTNKLITTYHPQAVGIEKIFFQKNLKTATTVAQARGVILLSIIQHHLPFVELSPNTVKMAIAGNGKANKQQVKKMIELLLTPPNNFAFDDTYDALAIALTAMSYL